MSQALHGIRILDLTHMLSGPYAGMILADLGAETIKVEPIGGEGTRALLAGDPKHSFRGMGAYFITLNRSKKSICVDLKQEQGRAVFHDLVRVSDVVLDNFSAGVTAKLGIDHAHLSAINERIITCSVSGFGQDGPNYLRPAFDQVVQGIGGGMSITGESADRPMRSGIPIGDLAGGMFAVMGVLAALQARTRHGRGQHVDISMLDCQISMLNYMATMHLMSGENPEPLGNGHFVHVPYNKAEEALAKLAAGGRVTGDAIFTAARGAVAMSELTGKSIDQAVSDFERLGEDPVKNVVKLNETYHFLTLAVYEQIKALQDQGNQEAATSLAMQAAADALDRRRAQIVDNAGAIEKAWRGVKNTVAEVIDNFAQLGRTDLEGKLRAAYHGLAGQRGRESVARRRQLGRRLQLHVRLVVDQRRQVALERILQRLRIDGERVRQLDVRHLDGAGLVGCSRAPSRPRPKC